MKSILTNRGVKYSVTFNKVSLGSLQYHPVSGSVDGQEFVLTCEEDGVMHVEPKIFEELVLMAFDGHARSNPHTVVIGADTIPFEQVTIEDIRLTFAKNGTKKAVILKSPPKDWQIWRTQCVITYSGNRPTDWEIYRAWSLSGQALQSVGNGVYMHLYRWPDGVFSSHFRPIHFDFWRQYSG